MNNLTVTPIDYHTAQSFVIKYHYLHRRSPYKYAFGLFQDGALVGVCIFARPFSSQLQKMICGEEESQNVIELTRLCVHDDQPKNTESWFVAQCLNSGIINEDIIVSFADESVGHNGTIYQALNFMYTGLTNKKKNFKIVGQNKHALTIASKYTADELRTKYGSDFVYENRPQKHRYVYLNAHKRRMRYLLKQLKLKQLPYPKKKPGIAPGL